MKRFALPFVLILLAALSLLVVRHREEKSRVTFASNAVAGSSASAGQAVAGLPVETETAGPPEKAQVAKESAAQASVPGSSGAALRKVLPVTRAFVLDLANGPERVNFPLPGGAILSGVVEQRLTDAKGDPVGVAGRVESPQKGRFVFAVQPAGDLAGPVTGTVYFDSGPIGYRVLRAGEGSELTELPDEEVVCRMPAAAPEWLAEQAAQDGEEIPAEHPDNIPIPAYQNGIIPLQSRPGAVAVVYMDFDGEKGPQPGWGEFDAAAPTVTNSQVREVWARVAEDYAPFNINITTDLQVYQAAPANSRQHCIITPTTTAAPGAGGVALVGSFDSTAGSPCWAFYSTGKSAAEVVSHEVGHTLGLSHDGRISPAESYYGGHGTDPVGWAPIMGVGYYKNLSQWSKGEYASANQTQDDLAIISGANNNVAYRPDDAGATHETAATLEIFNNGTVDSEGVIETRTDVDAFKFTTTGGAVNVTVAPVDKGPDLDLQASIYDASNTLILAVNPDAAINAKLTTTLPAGEYTIRVDGVGRGDPLGTGYTDYASLGQYTIAGTIAGTQGPSRFTIAENSAAGAVIGAPALLKDHAGAAVAWSIAAGNTGNGFTIDPASGMITVANAAALDYEALSPGWTQTPAFNLTVVASDPVDASLNESLRVVVTVMNVNEPPVIASSTIQAISRTVPGTYLGTVNASDPDEFDFPAFSIMAGNDDGKFAIDANGRITATGNWETMLPAYDLTIQVTDQGSPALSSTGIVRIKITSAGASYTPGVVYRTMYEGISGNAVSDLTSNVAFPNSPTRLIRIADFTDNTRGDNYGSVVRTWMVAPVTGVYRFWIAGDDGTELWFAPSTNAAAMTRVAFRNSASSYQDWTARTSQQSSPFNLTAGQVCYLEARQKEGGGGDHVAVAWEIRDAANNVLTARDVIPGRFLSPHFLTAPGVPAGLTGVTGNGAVTLSWSAPATGTVQGYRVKRATFSGGPYEVLASGVAGTSYVDTTALQGVTYYYQVTAVNDAGESAASGRLGIYLPDDTRLSGQPVGAGTVAGAFANAFDGQLGSAFSLTSGAGWVGLDLGAGNERFITGLRFSPPNGNTGSQTNANAMIGGRMEASNTADFSSDTLTLFTISLAPVYGTYTDAAVPPPVKGYRYLRYIAADGQAAAISELQFYGVARPAAPQGLQLASTTEGIVALTWNAVPTASRYAVKRAMNETGPYQALATDLIVTSFSETLPVPQGDYFYVVSAFNEAGESIDSLPLGTLDDYGRWLVAAGFTPGGENSGFDQDADGDGLANGTEYMIADGPVILVDETGAAMTAILRKDASVGIELMASDDLETWTPAVFDIGPDQTGVPEGFERVMTAPAIPGEIPGRFYRFTFTR